MSSHAQAMIVTTARALDHDRGVGSGNWGDELSGGDRVARARGQLIMQIHYNMASGSFPDQTAIKLSLKDQVARPGTMSVFGNNDLSIPPGLSEHVESQSVELRRVGVRTPRLLGILLAHARDRCQLPA